LLTVTVTLADTAWFPAVSVALAASVCAPFDADHRVPIGLLLGRHGHFRPEIRAIQVGIERPAMPSLPDASADIVTMLEIAALFVGAVIATVGGVGSRVRRNPTRPPRCKA